MDKCTQRKSILLIEEKLKSRIHLLVDPVATKSFTLLHWTEQAHFPFRRGQRAQISKLTQNSNKFFFLPYNCRIINKLDLIQQSFNNIKFCPFCPKFTTYTKIK